MLNVLIACEESQRVCIEMRKLGHRAFSCDILPCSGGHPEWHIQGDCLPYLNGDYFFTTCDGKIHMINGPWDLIIAHPPCTYLTVSGNAYFNEEKYGDKARDRKRRRLEAAEFFMRFVEAECPKVAIENPVGYMNTHYRKPDQIIQPYQFGHPIRKSTCLWLKGLPKLKETDVVEQGKTDKYGFTIGGAMRYATDENGKILSWNDPRTARERSKTFPGIARAMAEQWTSYIEDEKAKHEPQEN